jgi:hypothetical protein
MTTFVSMTAEIIGYLLFTFPPSMTSNVPHVVGNVLSRLHSRGVVFLRDLWAAMGGQDCNCGISGSESFKLPSPFGPQSLATSFVTLSLRRSCRDRTHAASCFSVMRMLLCPRRIDTSSMGTPSFKSSTANVWRNR